MLLGSPADNQRKSDGRAVSLDSEIAVEDAPARSPDRAGRAAAFDYLCWSLSRHRAATETAGQPGPDFDWVALVEQANRERVVTNLHLALNGRGWPSSAPEDLRDYLAMVYEANAAQNRAIRQQAQEVAAILNGAGASFAFLKGANWLFEAAEERIGERWLSDIDLVVAAASWERALGAIEAAGFRPATDPAIYARHFHHVPLARAGDRVTIEIHRHLGWQRRLLTSEEVVAAAEFRPGDPPLPLSSPDHRFIFGCLHAQLQNMEHAAGHFSLRDLCDIQYLRDTQGHRLDWPAIANFARSRRIFPYLAASLHLCHRLLGLTIPEPFADSRPASRHAARCLLQHRGTLRPQLTAFAVKFAWLVDSRRLAYELDCEEAPWLKRQARITAGRMTSILRRLIGRRRSSPGAPFPAESAPPMES